MIPVLETSTHFSNQHTLQNGREQIQSNMCTPNTQHEGFQDNGYQPFLQPYHSYKGNIGYPFFRFSQGNQESEQKQEVSKVTLACAQVWLEHQGLWRRFSMSGNEMIITKMGRRMFPVLAFSIYGLNQIDMYSMEVEVVPADHNRYKYVSVSGWRVNGVASEHEGNKRMIHPDGCQTGEYWQRNGVAFKRIKLTNKKNAKEGSNQIVLNSMHKYQIQLVIRLVNDKKETVDSRNVLFKETTFIAVTAYQNDDITQLKIDHNPFAKAFRDSTGDAGDNSPSPDDIYSLSPKRRRYSDMSIVTSPPSLFHQDFSFKHTINYSFPPYSPDNAFMSQETEKAYRKMFHYGNTSYINDRHMATTTNAGYPPLNFPTNSWLPNISLATNEYDNGNNNSNDNSSNNNNTDLPNEFIIFKNENQYLPSCRN